jgi:hypothetical protein
MEGCGLAGNGEQVGASASRGRRIRGSMAERVTVFVFPLPDCRDGWFERDRITDDGVYLTRHSKSVLASNPDANKDDLLIQTFQFLFMYNVKLSRIKQRAT